MDGISDSLSDHFVIGFTCGAMDLLHAGHVLMLKEAKACCDYLIIGLHTDPAIDRPEKNNPIQSIEERIIQLEGCSYVDRIIKYKTEVDLYRILSKLSSCYPNFVRIIGKDWEGKEFTGCDLPIQLIFNSRTHNYSSSELRRRIYEAEKETG